MIGVNRVYTLFDEGRAEAEIVRQEVESALPQRCDGGVGESQAAKKSSLTTSRLSS
jgi:hypothetical protein